MGERATTIQRRAPQRRARLNRPPQEAPVIKPTAVYSRADVGRLLRGKSPDDVSVLLDSGAIKARKVSGKWLILGQAVIDFLRGDGSPAPTPARPTENPPCDDRT